MKKVKLGEVCEIRIGKTPNRSQTLYWGGDYPWLSISDMKGKILCTTKEKITQEAVQKEKMQIVSKGTVVMSFKLSIGKVGILAENMYTNEAIANFVVKNNKMLFNEYLYYALQGINFDSLTDRAVMGKTLNKAKLNNLSIVYNEPFMQQQIVLRLDGVNKLIESRKQQLSELSKLVKARFNEMFGDISKFDVERLNNSVKEMFIGPFGSSLKNDYFVSKEKAYCMVYEQKHAIKKTMNLETRYVDEKKYKELKRFSIYGGDIIVSCRGTIGEIFQVPNNAPLGIMHPSIMKIRLDNSKYNPIFFKFMLSDYMDIEKIKSKGSGVKMAITASELGKIGFPLPPLSLQNEFADFVAQVDKSQLAIQKSLEELETLKKSLMQEYFG